MLRSIGFLKYLPTGLNVAILSSIVATTVEIHELLELGSLCAASAESRLAGAVAVAGAVAGVAARAGALPRKDRSANRGFISFCV